jgi:hypothetical protein
MAIPTNIPFVRLRESKQLLDWSKKLIDDLQSRMSLLALTVNSISAGAGAPNSASYLTLALDAALTAERVFGVTAGHLTAVDTGPNGALTVGLPNVGPGVTTKGDATHSAIVTIDIQGRVTALTDVLISGGGSVVWDTDQNMLANQVYGG